MSGAKQDVFPQFTFRSPKQFGGIHVRSLWGHAGVRAVLLFLYVVLLSRIRY